MDALLRNDDEAIDIYCARQWDWGLSRAITRRIALALFENEVESIEHNAFFRCIENFNEFNLVNIWQYIKFSTALGRPHDFVDKELCHICLFWNLTRANFICIIAFTRERQAVAILFTCLRIRACLARTTAIDVGFVLILDAVGARLFEFALRSCGVAYVAIAAIRRFGARFFFSAAFGARARRAVALDFALFA